MTDLQLREKLTRFIAALQAELEDATNAGQTDRMASLRAKIAALEKKLSGTAHNDPVVQPIAGSASTKALASRPKWTDIKNRVVAPYRFIPLNETVVPPEHLGLRLDEPLPEGGSAELEVTWGIETPLLIGRSLPTGPQQPDIVVPLSLGGATQWVIPGATLRGLIRSSLEIIAFARLRQVNDHFRFGVRDFTHSRYRDDAEVVVGKDSEIHAGWLIKTENGFSIKPCSRQGRGWGYIKIKDLPGIASRVDWASKTRDQKYSALRGKIKGFSERGRRANNGVSGQTLYYHNASGDAGELVVSGPVPVKTETDADGKRFKSTAKRFEYVLFWDEDSPTVPIGEAAWKAFEVMNCRQGRTRMEPEGAWKDAQSKLAEPGDRVPVFWVGDLNAQRNDFAFGLTRLFKIPHKYAVRDKIPKHLKATLEDGETPRPEIDFVENLFGYVYERDELNRIAPGRPWPNAEAHKGRIAFGFARPVAAAAFSIWPEQRPQDTIMMAPRASYAPYYLTGTEKDWSSPTAQLAGRKRYPPRYEISDLDRADGELQERLKDPIDRYKAGDRHSREAPDSVRSRLRFLRPETADAAFTSTIKLHNVSEIELGAVLWALTFGDDSKGLRRHMLGRAKGMGAGQTAVRKVQVSWRPHRSPRIDEAWPTGSTAGLAARSMAKFESYMEQATNGCWRNSATIEDYLRLHAPGTWAALAGGLTKKLGAAPAPADERDRVVRRGEGDGELATTFLARPDLEDPKKQKTFNDFQRIREATKQAYKGMKKPDAAIPLRLLTIP